MPWLLPILLLLIWFIISETGAIPTYLLPHPRQILVAAFNYLFAEPGMAPYAGRFLSDFYASMLRVLSGFSLAVLIGLPLGILSGRVEQVSLLLSTSINGLRAVPGISLLPLALIWFGIGLKTTIFLVALAAFFPIYLNAEAGARQVSPTLLQAGAMLGGSPLRGVFSVLFPAAMPHIVTGLRLGMGISWSYLVLGELTGVPNGLGALIMDARMLGRIDIIVVGIILIAMIGKICDSGLHLLLQLCFKSARRLA
ncbi:ABC transporter permease [uncultured Desulfuromusa sp.]|uniref:ABC transporter permease n=1 Tax=uncultured Desulfuromusa sp. TaxID=219183 RepID=UPI002AA6595E|nr:ABC transporter permease [uncultured Desulfuromusa sp.]